MSGAAKTIVVGYDGSEAGAAALSYAAERAGEGGTVYVVHAYGPPPDFLGYPSYERILQDHLSHGEELLERAVAERQAASPAVTYETELLGGSPAEALIRVAEARDADEIVVGSRGFGRLRSVLGSVSHELLHLADRPVVVIPYKYAAERSDGEAAEASAHASGATRAQGGERA